MASAARTSLYREHGGGTGRKVAARPNRARSVADAWRTLTEKTTVAFEREGSGPYALGHDPAICPSPGPSAERNYMPSGG